MAAASQNRREGCRTAWKGLGKGRLRIKELAVWVWGGSGPAVGPGPGAATSPSLEFPEQSIVPTALGLGLVNNPSIPSLPSWRQKGFPGGHVSGLSPVWLWETSPLPGPQKHGRLGRGMPHGPATLGSCPGGQLWTSGRGPFSSWLVGGHVPSSPLPALITEPSDSAQPDDHRRLPETLPLPSGSGSVGPPTSISSHRSPQSTHTG